MKILASEILSESPGRVNEDSACLLPTAAWILDGASALDRRGSGSLGDARWYVSKMDEYLRAEILAPEPLSSVVQSCIKKLREAYRLEARYLSENPIHHPAASLALVRFTGARLEYFVLGDCPLLIKRRGAPVEVIFDERVSLLDRRVALEIHRLQIDTGCNFLHAKSAALPQLTANRRLKNSEKGYWIAEFDPGAVEHSRRGLETVSDEVEILMMSDGFAQIADMLCPPCDLAELFERMKEQGIQALYRRLKELTSRDEECLRVPRLKCRDDASAIYLDLCVEGVSPAKGARLPTHVATARR